MNNRLSSGQGRFGSLPTDARRLARGVSPSGKQVRRATKPVVRVLQAIAGRQRRGGADIWTDSSLRGDSQQGLADSGDKFISKWSLSQNCPVQPFMLSQCRVFLDTKAGQERGARLETNQTHRGEECFIQVRALRRIEEGEEILICYSRLGGETRSRARRAYLKVSRAETLMISQLK